MNKTIIARSTGCFMLFVLATISFGFNSPPVLAKDVPVPVSFADIAEKLGPTVVNIYTTQVQKARKVGEPPPLHNNDIPEFFRRFFDVPREMPREFDELQPKDEQKTSLGSGVIHTADGYIITNYHVVENADTINVRLTNQEEFEAKVIGRDPKTDIALIKIESKSPLPFVVFGDSDALRIGDWVIAIGNPFGFEHTVTAGIVSAKGRAIGAGPYENFIQTDASINLGNSGGPLFNLEGKMVGLNTAIFSQNGGNIGLGFSIPINMAKNIIKQLKEHGSVTRGWLGVMIQNVDSDLAKKFSLERPIGALVGEVVPDSPAAKAGIKTGDIIINYQGQEITQMNALPAMVAQTAIGAKEELVLIRDGKKITVSIVIGKLEEEKVGNEREQEEAAQKLGLTLQELTPELAGPLGLDESKGLIVVNVLPNTPAALAGLQRGDLIMEVNKTPVVNLPTYNKILNGIKKNEKLLLLINRNKHTRYVVVKND